MAISPKKIHDIILATFLADSYAVGVQWVYDLKKLDALLPLTSLASHPADGFHKGKEAGELTNYGDHMYHLLQFLDEHGSFNIKEYAKSWQQFFSQYTGYRDHASKTAYKRLAKSPEAIKAEKFPVADMIGAARFSPLLLVASDDASQLFSLSLEESQLSYDHALIADALQIMIDMVLEAAAGTEPVILMERVVKKDSPATEFLKNGWNRRTKDSREAVAELGSACGVDGGMGIIAHLVGKYPDNLFDGLVANAAGSGDVAARSIGYAMFMSAYYGTQTLPPSWLSDLHITDFIEKVVGRWYG